ncbi:MAG: aconitase X [Candidatus Ranarchaeia archaeon]
MGEPDFELSQYEQEMLDGEHGEAKRYATETLLKFGKIFGAKRFVPIKSTHVSCTSITIERALIPWLKQLLDWGGKIVVPGTTMVTGYDLCRWEELGMDKVPGEIKQKHDEQLGLLYDLGLAPTHTCTQYWLPGFQFSKGDIITTCESSAVIYVNSVTGAWTNRDNCSSALLAGIIGRTPEFGFLIKENRAPKIEVNVSAKLKNQADWSIMGLSLGDRLGIATPIFTGKIGHATNEDMSNMSAALSATSGVSMFHIEGVTPEAETKEIALQGNEIKEKWEFSRDDLLEAYRPWRDKKGVPVDYVYVGCPHASIFELHRIAELLRGRQIAGNVDFWIGTCRPIWDQADMLGLIEKIEESGAKVIRDTCMGSAKLRRKHPRRVMTEATKVMWYWRSAKEDPEYGCPRLIGSMKECVETAVAGSFMPDWLY